MTESEHSYFCSDSDFDPDLSVLTRVEKKIISIANNSIFNIEDDVIEEMQEKYFEMIKSYKNFKKDMIKN